MTKFGIDYYCPRQRYNLRRNSLDGTITYVILLKLSYKLSVQNQNEGIFLLFMVGNTPVKSIIALCSRSWGLFLCFFLSVVNVSLVLCYAFSLKPLNRTSWNFVHIYIKVLEGTYGRILIIKKHIFDILRKYLFWQIDCL